MDKVFIYWDNSNILIGARAVAEEREGVQARHRVRISFKAMMRLAHADRPVELVDHRRALDLQQRLPPQF